MDSNKTLELLVFMQLEELSRRESFSEWIKADYDVEKINERYLALTKEFLTEYALDKQEKS